MNNALSLHVAILGSYLVLCLPFLKDWMQSLRVVHYIWLKMLYLVNRDLLIVFNCHEFQFIHDADAM